MHFKVNYAICMALIYLCRYIELLNVNDEAIRKHTYYNGHHN